MNKKYVVVFLFISIIIIFWIVLNVASFQNEFIFSKGWELEATWMCNFVGPDKILLGDYYIYHSRSEEKDICIGHIYGKQQSSKICATIESGLARQTCMARVISNPKNIESCEYIEETSFTKNYKTECWYWLAIKENNNSYCEFIEDKKSPFYLGCVELRDMRKI